MTGDLRYAWRMICKSPGVTAVIVLILALAIGANTAVFSMVDGILLRPLPYKDPARLVDVLDASVKDARLSKTFGDYNDFETYSKHARSFEKIAFATWATSGMTLTGSGPSRNILAIPVSEDFFSMLGVSAARGRTFEHSDLNGGCPVVLSDSFWRDSLAGEPNIVGHTLTLDHRACTVIGIMPAGFEFYPRHTQLWVLLTPDDPRPRDRLLTSTFARLKPGVTKAQAEADLLPLHKAIHKDDWQRDFIPVVDSLQEEFTILAGRNLRGTSVLLLAAVTLVLLIACLNVANILFGRAIIRAREFAVRAALGSGRARLIRQLLLENLLLAAAGGILGVAIAFGAMRYLRYANPIELPAGASVSISLPVLVFSAALTILTVLLFGLAPAWSGSRVDPAAGRRTAGRGAIHGSGPPTMRALIACEIALALVLLSSASLLMRSVLKMSAAPLGFDPAHLAVMSTTLPEQRYKSSADKLRYYDELTRKLNAIPGIQGAAIATTMPPYSSGNWEVQVEGKHRAGVQDVSQNLIGPDYFRVLRIALRRGRIFDYRDRQGSAPVAIVNDTFVREYLAAMDPIGTRVRTFGFGTGPWVTIVGVVATEKHPEFLHEMAWYEQAALYRPLAQDPPGYISIALRTHREDVAHALEAALTSVDKDVPAGNVETMHDRLGALLKYPRFRAFVIDGAPLALVAVSLLAIIKPAVTAARLDPVTALRED